MQHVSPLKCEVHNSFLQAYKKVKEYPKVILMFPSTQKPFKRICVLDLFNPLHVSMPCFFVKSLFTGNSFFAGCKSTDDFVFGVGEDNLDNLLWEICKRTHSKPNINKFKSVAIQAKKKVGFGGLPENWIQVVLNHFCLGNDLEYEPFEIPDNIKKRHELKASIPLPLQQWAGFDNSVDKHISLVVNIPKDYSRICEEDGTRFYGRGKVYVPISVQAYVDVHISPYKSTDDSSASNSEECSDKNKKEPELLYVDGSYTEDFRLPLDIENIEKAMPDIWNFAMDKVNDNISESLKELQEQSVKRTKFK